MTKNQVAVYRQSEACYSNKPPYNSPRFLPESPLDTEPDTQNIVYESIRNALHLLRLDEKNFNKPNWNPLQSLINPGETVLIKPNLIAHSHKYNDNWEYVITHGSVIRAIMDYVYIALNGQGRIIVADGPQTDSHIDLIKDRIGIKAIQELYWNKKKFEIEFLDLRDEYWIEEDGICLETVKLPGDPLGNVQVNLNAMSFFAELDGRNKKYYGAFYDIGETNRHHTDGVHRYMLSRTALESDVFISLPKLKTHKKVGVTLNLKGLVGINGNKNWLPHYSIGSPEDEGDQFTGKSFSSNLENRFVMKAKQFLLMRNSIAQLMARKLIKVGYAIFGDTEKVVRSGNWYGNDTCWRMVLDLNRILLYGRSDGCMGDTPKRYFSVIDGIIGMEGSGPNAGKPKRVGFIAAGQNSLAVDMVCTKLIGFDYRKIPMLYRAFDNVAYPLAKFTPNEIYVLSNEKVLEGNFTEIRTKPFLKFDPHFGWKGHIEL